MKHNAQLSVVTVTINPKRQRTAARCAMEFVSRNGTNVVAAYSEDTYHSLLAEGAFN